MRTIGAAAALAVVLGCGGSSSPTSRSAQESIPVDPVPEVPATPTSAPPGPVAPGGGDCGGKVTVRLRGVIRYPLPEPPGSVDHAIDVSGVEARQGGSALAASEVARGVVTFPVSGAYRMAVLPLDRSGGPVDVTIRTGCDRYCDVGTGDGGATVRFCYDIPACGGEPIQLRFDPAKVRADSCHVVVALDLDTSVKQLFLHTVRFFIPEYKVQY